MEDRFHNRSASEIAELAYQDQKKIKEGEQDLAACRQRLIELAGGGRIEIEVPTLCRVTITAPPRLSSTTSYYVDHALFESLKPETRDRLI